MLKYAVAALLLTTLPSNAQTVVDESAAALDAKLVKQAVEVVSADFTDPLSSQFKLLHKAGDGSVCGYVNTKNTQGGYVGFKPFKFIPDRQKVYLGNTGC